jgi:hypothetical protein
MCQPIAAADKPAKLELSCCGRSDFYIDLKSVRLLLRVKLNWWMRPNSAEPNLGCCVNNLLQSVFSSLSVSLNGKRETLHETNYYYET